MKVAISSDFLSAFSAVPKKQQAKVRDFIEKFKRDPRANGINYEKINGSKDKNIRSVRIDQTYRGIVLKPESGDVYLLLWVDHHDEAYEWAKSRVCSVHPETGSLQVVSVSEEEAAVQPAESAEEKRLFGSIRDRELLSLGIPSALLPLVRTMKTEQDLDRAEARFPDEASEALYLLAMGYSVEETYAELNKHEPREEVNTQDFASALENEDSKRRFYVVDNDLEFQAILSSPLEKWRVFLHPAQRRIVNTTFNGPARVLGGAGTGKTVVAMHRAKWLADTVCTGPADRILFTTYTRNLAADIADNLSKICGDDAFKKIEIVNLDRWVASFLKSNDYPHNVGWFEQTKEYWDAAINNAPTELGLKPGFYREEWERVIQPLEIETVDQYMKAKRLGRGTRLGRKERKQVWPVFEEYRLLLNEHNLKEAEDAMRDARLILEKRNIKQPYRTVVVDEAQDMSAQAFRLIRAMVPADANDIFIVGDGHQRIYRGGTALSKCGIEIRGRSRRLRVNYRTTEEIRRWAVAILEGQSIDDLDDGTDNHKGYKSLLRGVAPHIHHADSFKAELDHIVGILEAEKKQGNELNNICLTARTNELLDEYAQQLKAKSFECYMIKRSKAEDRKAPGLRLATMHRVKGLEFDKVIVAGVSKEWIPYQKGLQNASDTVAKNEVELLERALLYVASTRAKKEVWVTGHGEKSEFVPES